MVSLASEPELEKNAWFRSSGVSSASLAARRTVGSVVQPKKLL